MSVGPRFRRSKPDGFPHSVYWQFVHGLRNRQRGVPNFMPTSGQRPTPGMNEAGSQVFQRAPGLSYSNTSRAQVPLQQMPSRPGQVPAQFRRAQGGGGHGITGMAQRGGTALSPPQAGGVVGMATDIWPSIAEDEAYPNLIGEIAPTARRVAQRASCAYATSSQALAPRNLGLNAPGRRPSRSAIAVTHAPDAQMIVSATERTQQLPSKPAYYRVDQAKNDAAQAAASVRPTAAAGEAGDHAEVPDALSSRPSKRRRVSLFL